jgi:hypothetical protein
VPAHADSVEKELLAQKHVRLIACGRSYKCVHRRRRAALQGRVVA